MDFEDGLCSFVNVVVNILVVELFSLLGTLLFYTDSFLNNKNSTYCQKGLLGAQVSENYYLR